jgi:hypothetical protein
VRIPRLPIIHLLTAALGLFSLSVSRGQDAAPATPDPLPKILDDAGAMTEAQLASWRADSPEGYSGHYVSQTVTDGWEEMLLTIKNTGTTADPRWVVDAYVRDSRDDDHKDGITYPGLPLTLGPNPFFRLQEGGKVHYFALRTLKGAKGPVTRPMIAVEGGAYFALHPEVPQAVLLGGKELMLKFGPWQEIDPTAYAGTYISQSRDTGSREVEITVKKEPGSQLPWRVDVVNTTTGTKENNPDYEYKNRPLWTGPWPHFDAHDTFVLILFADPRGGNATALPSLITEKGEVLVRLQRPAK